MNTIEISRPGTLPPGPPKPSISGALAERGWWAGPCRLPRSLTASLYSELANLSAGGSLKRAGIGRGRGFQVDPDQRGDRIAWIRRGTLARNLFLDSMEAMRLELNRTLFLGLFEFESHFALYPPGAGYRRHLDSFRGAASRVVSVVVYLNPRWQKSDGGELVLYYPESGAVAARVLPRAGTRVVFLSEEIPHQVLPARKPRASIAGWFRVNNTSAERVDPAL